MYVCGGGLVAKCPILATPKTKLPGAVCVKLNHFAVYQKLKHYKSTKLQFKKGTEKKENQNFFVSLLWMEGKKGEEEGEEEKDETGSQ